MRNQPECDFGVMPPVRVLRLDKELFVVVQDVERHRPDSEENRALGTQPQRSPTRNSFRHGDLLVVVRNILSQILSSCRRYCRAASRTVAPRAPGVQLSQSGVRGPQGSAGAAK